MTENNKSSLSGIIVTLLLFSIVSNSTFSGNLSIPSHNFLIQPAIGQQLDSDMARLNQMENEFHDSNQKWNMVFNKEQEQSGEIQPVSSFDDYLKYKKYKKNYGDNSNSGMPIISPLKPSSPNTLHSAFTQFEPENQQQGGSAISGDATGGAANAGGIVCVEGAYCTIYNNPQATGGQAASGAATGGAATSKESTHIHTLVYKGNALFNQKNYAEAIQYYDEALAIDPNNKYVLYDKGNALRNLGKNEEAITWYDKALDVDPNYKEALNSKGAALHSLGKYEEAITWYDKALDVDPNYKVALNNKKEALSMEALSKLQAE